MLYLDIDVHHGDGVQEDELLVITDVDTGAYMLALTRHSVLAAPYHRLGPQIIQNMRILSLPPEEAKQQVIGLGAAYVAICRARHAQRPAELPPGMRCNTPSPAAAW